jgi:MoaA/NifB/PqqE/SkfB family radical SAM enzyme
MGARRGGGQNGRSRTEAAVSPMHGASAKREAAFVPAVLDLSVDEPGPDGGFVDPEAFARALPILARRGVRHLNFQGREPLRHPAIVEMVAAARGAGMRPNLVTDGRRLTEQAGGLADAGVQNLLVTIGGADTAAHGRDRGGPALSRRIEQGIARMRARGVPVVASVVVSRRIDFDALPDALERLGFDAASFSYPRQPCDDFTDEELLAALEAILRMRDRFPVLNPAASIRDVQRHLRGEPERFACVGGFKYFYMDRRLDVWRCEAWAQPIGSVFELDRFPDDRSRCTACTLSCYRDASALMHAGIAAADAAAAMARAQPIAAARALFNDAVAQSLGATLAEAGLLTTLGLRRAPFSATRAAGW